MNATEIANSVVVGILTIDDIEILAEGLAAPTVVRIRGNCLMALDPATSVADVTQQIGFGIIVVKSTVSSSEVGGPLAEENLDWMYWRTSQLQANSVITSTGVSADAGHVRFDFDIKAMRKIHKSSIHMIVENAGVSAAHVFVSAGWSVLFQE